MKPRDGQSESASIERAAADWLVRRRDGLPPALEQGYRAWLAADPRHQAAIDELQGAWGAVSFPAVAGREREAAALLDEWKSARHRRGWYLSAAAGLTAAALAVVAILPSNPSPPVGREIAAVVRPNIESLPDGSTVELNAAAEITVDYAADRRSVQLNCGEALFSVRSDPARPFIVSAGGVQVRAVGTAFAVRRDSELIGVLVTEGTVAVERLPAAASPVPDQFAPAAPPLYVEAGRRVAIALAVPSHVAPAIESLSADEIRAALDWRGKRVEFSRMALGDAAALFNRQNRLQLIIADRATETMAISGIFWADDPEGFVRLLDSGLGVRARRAGDTITLSSR